MAKIAKRIFLFTLIAITFFPLRIVYSQSNDSINIPKLTTPDGEESVGKALSPLIKKQSAPFTGVLLSPEAVAEITAELNSIQEQIDNAVKFNSAKLGAVHAYDEKIFKIELRTAEQVHAAQSRFLQGSNDILLARIKSTEDNTVDPIWYTSLGFGVGALATILITFAINQTSK